FISNTYKLNINPILEIVMLADFGGIALPARSKFILENHKVWVPHGNRNAAYFSKGNLNGEFIAHLRFPHRNFELEGCIGMRSQCAGFNPSAGAYVHTFAWRLRAQVGGNAARAIARNFCIRTVGVDQASANVGILHWKKPLDAIGANSVVAVAD